MITLSRLVLFFIAAVATLGTKTAGAHDPYDITADVRFAGELIEVTITQSRFTALAICSEATGGRKTFGPHQFDEIKPALEKCARNVFHVVVSNRRLAPKTVEAALTRESDIEFHLVFPRPAKGPVRLEAALLRSLTDPGYGVVTTVLIDGALFERRTLRAADPVMEVVPPEAKTSGH